MLNEQVKEYIERSVLCWLASANEDQPSVSPKEVFTYHGEDTVLIGNIASPQSVKNIRRNKKVCVSFIDIFSQKGFQLYGLASEFKAQSKTERELQSLLQDKAGETFIVKSVISVKVTEIKEIIAPSYRLKRNITEEEMIRSAMRTYGVKPLQSTE